MYSSVFCVPLYCSVACMSYWSRLQLCVELLSKPNVSNKVYPALASCVRYAISRIQEFFCSDFDGMTANVSPLHEIMWGDFFSCSRWGEEICCCMRLPRKSINLWIIQDSSPVTPVTEITEEGLSLRLCLSILSVIRQKNRNRDRNGNLSKRSAAQRTLLVTALLLSPSVLWASYTLCGQSSVTEV